MRAKKADLDRFRTHVRSDGDCWVWTAHRDSRGYGKFKVNGRKERAHRWIYEALHGELPESVFLDHLCRNTACVRPSHLEPASPEENTKRGTLYRR
ncbi:MAG: HNH endonuclease [Actinobacteria bacterium]|nr:HNH endonuclease [Actinomycetota bacterium]